MVRTPDPRMIRHRGDQVAPRNQFVAFDGDVVVDCPAAPLETSGEVKGQPVDIIPIRRGWLCQTPYVLTGNSSGKTTSI
jgi:hypothetical protein